MITFKTWHAFEKLAFHILYTLRIRTMLRHILCVICKNFQRILYFMLTLERNKKKNSNRSRASQCCQVVSSLIAEETRTNHGRKVCWNKTANIIYAFGFVIVHRLFRSVDGGNKSEKKVCSHSKQYRIHQHHCLTTLFHADSHSTPYAYAHTHTHIPSAASHSCWFSSCTLSRFWHLFSFYFTLSLAELKIVFHIRALCIVEWIPELILLQLEWNARKTSSTVSKTITCEKRDVPHDNHKTFHLYV